MEVMSMSVRMQLNKPAFLSPFASFPTSRAPLLLSYIPFFSFLHLTVSVFFHFLSYFFFFFFWPTRPSSDSGHWLVRSRRRKSLPVVAGDKMIHRYDAFNCDDLTIAKVVQATKLQGLLEDCDMHFVLGGRVILSVLWGTSLSSYYTGRHRYVPNEGGCC